MATTTSAGKKESESAAFGWVWLIVIGAAFWYFFDFGLGSDQIVDYSFSCKDYNYSQSICPGSHWSKDDKVIYTVNKDQQMVISQSGDSPPSRLSKCVVVDRKNWKCEGLLGTSFGFTNGKYFQEFPIDSVKHVSQWEWNTTW